MKTATTRTQHMPPPKVKERPNVDRFLMSLGGSVAGGAFLGANLAGVWGALGGAAVGIWAASSTLRSRNG